MKRAAAILGHPAGWRRITGICLRAAAVTLAVFLAMIIVAFVAGYAAAAMGIGIDVAIRFLGVLAVAGVVVVELQVAVFIWRRARRGRLARKPGRSNEEAAGLSADGLSSHTKVEKA